MNKSIITLSILSCIVLSTVVYGFLDGGSPTAAKNMRFDQTRIQHFQSIQGLIYRYYETNKKLPSTIQESITDGAYRASLIDPETQNGYTYHELNSPEYQLCTTFGTDTTKDQKGYMSTLQHPSGYYCLTFNASKY